MDEMASFNEALEQRRGLSTDRLMRLSQLERWHFWFIGRRALIDRLLKRYLSDKSQLVLDLGCGTGSMVEILMSQGHRVVGLDLTSEGWYAARQRIMWSWLLQADANHLPLKSSVFDAVMLLDVLEHVDDQAVLAEVKRILRPGGLALITVPAMPWLWSYRDKAAGHFRRYTRRQLAVVLTDGQLEVQEMRHYQCLLFPLVVITRLLGRRGPGLRDFEERPPLFFNAVMAFINWLEAKLSDVISWPWGSSLVALCRKM